MPTDLYLHIQQTPLCDTHEHLRSESEWIHNGPDILQDLFGNYLSADLVSAGASPNAMKDLMDAENTDFGARFEGIRPAWEAVQFTGYGEAVRLLASEIYGIESFSARELEIAHAKLQSFRKPGGRYHLLRTLANLDHVQTDDFRWTCEPDGAGPDFFLYDLSWAEFCAGRPPFLALAEETGISVTTLDSLQQAMEAIFEKYAPCAIAVKAQHAYNRSLRWQERTRSEAGRALYAALVAGEKISEEARLCLGDWCWARGVELAIAYDLPFKLHTGYYAGNNRMPIDYINPGHLCPLLARYLSARFVLMHIAYPFTGEAIALAKHYENVWVDLCWAWAINPYASADFVRGFLHAAPVNKLLAFGGDTGWPTGSAGYALQTRRWLTRVLQAEIDDGDLREQQAIHIATRIMRDNQYACFDLEGTRREIHKKMRQGWH